MAKRSFPMGGKSLGALVLGRPCMELVNDVAADYNKIAPRYDTLHKDQESLIENAAAFARVRGMLEDGPVADLGCGTGLLLDGVPELRSSSYIGIDISAGMLDQARRKFPRYMFKQASMTETGIVTSSIASVVSLFSAGNYVSIEDLAEEMERIMRPRGQFLLILRAYLAGKVEEGIPPMPFWHSSSAITCAFLERSFHELRTTGLTCHELKAKFYVVQGRRET